MDLKIRGKKALITGGSRGIGRSIAECLVQEGVDVAIVSRNKMDVNSFIEKNGKQNLGLIYDLMEESAPTQLANYLIENNWFPDIIIHNVGGSLDITDPLCSISDWKKVYRFNLEIAIELNLLLIPHLISQKWGRIIHISSIASLENQGTVPYCSIKAALNAYTRSIGRFLAPDGINVSSVLPGAVFTKDGYWDTASKERPDHVKKYLDERMAIKRFGTLDEIGKVVTFLCSEDASFIVGSSFLVDGGQGRTFLY